MRSTVPVTMFLPSIGPAPGAQQAAAIPDPNGDPAAGQTLAGVVERLALRFAGRSGEQDGRVPVTLAAPTSVGSFSSVLSRAASARTLREGSGSRADLEPYRTPVGRSYSATTASTARAGEVATASVSDTGDVARKVARIATAVQEAVQSTKSAYDGSGTRQTRRESAAEVERVFARVFDGADDASAAAGTPAPLDAEAQQAMLGQVADAMETSEDTADVSSEEAQLAAKLGETLRADPAALIAAESLIAAALAQGLITPELLDAVVLPNVAGATFLPQTIHELGLLVGADIGLGAQSGTSSSAGGVSALASATTGTVDASVAASAAGEGVALPAGMVAVEPTLAEVAGAVQASVVPAGPAVTATATATVTATVTVTAPDASTATPQAGAGSLSGQGQNISISGVPGQVAASIQSVERQSAPSIPVDAVRSNSEGSADPADAALPLAQTATRTMASAASIIPVGVQASALPEAVASSTVASTGNGSVQTANSDGSTAEATVASPVDGAGVPAAASGAQASASDMGGSDADTSGDGQSDPAGSPAPAAQISSPGAAATPIAAAEAAAVAPRGSASGDAVTSPTGNTTTAATSVAAPRDATTAAAAPSRGLDAGDGASPVVDAHDQVATVIVRQARLITAGGRQEMTINLAPEHLGSVHIRIALEGGGLSVGVTATKLETQRALEAALPQLRATLAESGLRLERLDVGQRDAGGNRGSSYGGNSESGSNGNPGNGSPGRQGQSGRNGGNPFSSFLVDQDGRPFQIGIRNADPASQPGGESSTTTLSGSVRAPLGTIALSRGGYRAYGAIRGLNGSGERAR